MKALWILAGLLFIHTSELLAAPDAVLWAYWQKSDETNTATIDHSKWQALLDQYLTTDTPSGVNLFRYDDVKPEDKNNLAQYLETLQKIDPRKYSSREQEAYWINFYNAATVKLILDHPDVDTIRDIGEGFFSSGPWDDKIATVAGQDLTLNDMEHRILRPIYKDKRIHYVVNCASMSCPNLPPRAFTASNLEEQLENGARTYINHPRGLTFKEGELVVSSIFIWYQSDFGDNERALLNYFAQYVKPDVVAKLKAYDGEIEDQYDWALNKP